VRLRGRPCPRGRLGASARMPHVRADAFLRPRGRNCPRGCWDASARMRCCIRADASVLPPGNFITDATVRPSHGQPSGHRAIVRLSVHYRPRDNPGWGMCQVVRPTPRLPTGRGWRLRQRGRVPMLGPSYSKQEGIQGAGRGNHWGGRA
jgi:hypothetical protein